MSVDIFAIVRDVLVIAYMFVLRIGVPLLITLMVGAWLRRLLEEKEEKVETVDNAQPAEATVKAKTH